MEKKKPDTNELLDRLEYETKELVINEFVTKHYKENSHKVYLNAIANMFNELDKRKAADLTIDDYYKIVPINRMKTAQETYCDSFFKFLFAYDYLSNPKGFEKIWTKDSSVKHFNRPKNSKNNKEELQQALNFEEIGIIQSILSKETENIEMLKMGFVWYMLFETDCPIDSLKRVKSQQFKNGELIISKKYKYHVPQKYHTIFDHLNERAYSGFYNLHDWVKKLGDLAGIGYLYPQKIALTRKQNMIPCGNCKKEYTNTNDNWISVNNRIICKNCYHSLKKKVILKIDAIREEKIDNLINTFQEINISSIVYTFDELRRKTSLSIDYLKLREFQDHIGKLGEAFVYDIEYKKLLGTKYEDKIDNTKAIDQRNGYDILSFELDGTLLHIEVKTTIFKESDFFISENELNTAKSMKEQGKKYLVYRVSDILSQNKEDIKVEIINDISDNKSYKFIETNYRVKRITE